MGPQYQLPHGIIGRSDIFSEGTAIALIINHNISALNTQRNLALSDRSLSKSLQKLSSGYKINVAADDPSGLIISEQLRSQTHGLQRAVQNSQEASNVIGIAEGALIEMNEILRKMRALALHAANSGVTAPDQVVADQSEVDSGVQTLDRIATTTRYSDQFLLNGSKGIVYKRSTEITDSMSHALLNLDQTNLEQIFKREGTSLSIQFEGEKGIGTQADYTKQATRAILEASEQFGSQISGTEITSDQSFILTGNNGTRLFNFAEGTKLGSMVDAVNNISGSTGIGATLCFDSTVTGVQVAANTTATRATTQPMFMNFDDTGLPDQAVGVTAVAAVDYTDVVSGINLDGDGRMWIEYTGTGTDYIAYKDRARTMEIGRGSSGAVMTESNNSGIGAAAITLTTSGGHAAGDTTMIQFGYQFELNTGAANNGIDETGLSGLSSATNLVINNGASAFSGIRLGENTDPNGQLYFEIVDAGAGADSIRIYKDSERNQEDLVAEATNLTLAAGSFQLFDVETNSDTGERSGLFATLTFTGAPPANGTFTGTVSFDQLGMRVYSEEYGSENYLRLQNIKGQMFAQYDSPDNTTTQLIGEGETVQEFGLDAMLALNGTPVRTNGLIADITTQDYSGELVFNPGELGLTTIAQVGQDVGALGSRIGAMQAIDEGAADVSDLTFATNARHGVSEVLGDFIGGMQYQLGEGEGDQERTVYGIRAMTAANIGKVTIDGQRYSLQDVLSGGSASLAADPILALKIVSIAINDVSDLRASLGAYQKNTLQTNINSLEVAIEQTTNTESAIRDANMAVETTEFTKSQILLQAGTAMLAHANTSSQGILQLLG